MASGLERQASLPAADGTHRRIRPMAGSTSTAFREQTGERHHRMVAKQ